MFTQLKNFYNKIIKYSSKNNTKNELYSLDVEPKKELYLGPKKTKLINTSEIINIIINFIPMDLTKIIIDYTCKKQNIYLIKTQVNKLYESNKSLPKIITYFDIICDGNVKTILPDISYEGFNIIVKNMPWWQCPKFLNYNDFIVMYFNKYSYSCCSVYIMKLIHDSIISVKALPTYKFVETSFCVFSNFIYAIGGIGGNWKKTNQVFKYKFENNIWIRSHSMHHERICPASIVIGDRLYVVGGNHKDISGGYTMEYYKEKECKWTLCDGRMSIPRQNHGIAFFDNKLIIVGGLTTQNNHTFNTKTVEIFDFKINKWRNTGSLNKAREQYVNVIVQNGQIICLGDYWKCKDKRELSEVYDPDLEVWNILDDCEYKFEDAKAIFVSNKE
jgi:hypothetical protein